MPVYRTISPGYPTSEEPGEATEAASQLSCSCPLTQETQVQDLAGGRTAQMESHTSPPLLDQVDALHYQQQHLSTCALHGTSIALLKQQAKQRQLEILRQEQQRRRDPFDPPRITPSKTFHLYAGSRFRGKQRSGSHSYDVEVDIKHVDLAESFLCGYLRINGLTEEYPELTTYFEAEIIGPKHSFLTRKWDADELIDEEHWTLFKPFECLASSVFYGLDVHDGDDEDDHMPCPHHHHYNPQTYNHRNEDVVFMRWKEHFLVPDHRVRGISGASFAGFYYICYSKTTGQISGYYYHQSSEKFQQLLLTHVESRSFASYEFR
ncbi:GID complex subunit 4, VID24 [Mortierella alpina]|nr:GID complex subunit 4, VID24 [Mortierella alpina]